MAKLPKIDQPTLVDTFPVSKTKVKYRPFVTKEQKAMLLAQNSQDPESIYETIKSIVTSCTDGTADVEKLPYGDLSWLFLKISNAATGPEKTVSITCKECEHEFLMGLNLDDVEVINLDTSNTVMITPVVGVKMRFPTYRDLMFIEDNTDDTVGILYLLTESIFDEEQIYTKTDFTKEEFVEWVEGFSDIQLGSFDKFISNLPDIAKQYDFNCPKCNQEYSKRVEGLLDFFRIKSGQF